MTELPALFHRRGPGLINVAFGVGVILGAAAIGVVQQDTPIRLGCALVMSVGVLIAASGVTSARRRLVVSSAGLAVHDGRRETTLLWDDITAIRLERVRGLQWAAQSSTYSAFVLLAGSPDNGLRCGVLDDFSRQGEFSAAVAAAGHADLDHLAADRLRFAEHDPFAEPMTLSQMLRHLPRSLVNPRIVLALVAVGGAGALMAWGISKITGGSHDWVGWVLVAVSSAWFELSRRDLWRRRRAVRRTALTL